MNRSQCLTESALMQIPALKHPGFRVELAQERGLQKKLLISTFGGIGDHICAEPTLRYALSRFTDCEISLITRMPALFRHLKFKEVLDAQVMSEAEICALTQRYLCFNTAVPNEEFISEFVSHNLTNCLDFPPICAFRMQLPVQDRPVMICPSVSDFHTVDALMLDFRKSVVIHPGRHWPSKTFPAHWWNRVTDCIHDAGAYPIIIGSAKPSEQGTVNISMVNGWGTDLRDQLSIMESAAILKQAKVLITNDSSPLHMAADSQCWIGFLATCKHPDLITHWRWNHGVSEWSWRMQNLSLGGLWETQHYCPNGTPASIDQVDPELLKTWLPKPERVAAWAISRL